MVFNSVNISTTVSLTSGTEYQTESNEKTETIFYENDSENENFLNFMLIFPTCSKFTP